MKKSLKDEIQFIQLETTSRCNLNCLTCLKPAYRDVWQERDMSTVLFNHILSELPSGISVHLQGWGEPLLHRDTLWHVEKLKNIGARVSFTTNGTIMGTSLAEAIAASGLDGLTFSVAGNSIATQDPIRGAGSFLLLQAAVCTLVEARKRSGKSHPRIAVSYLLAPGTIDELPGAIGWCRKKRVDSFVTVHLTQAGCLQQQELQFLLSKKQAKHYRLLRIRAHLQTVFSSMRLTLKEFHPTLTPVCDKNPLNSMFINVVGDVSPCVFLNPPVKKGLSWYSHRQNSIQQPVIFGNVQNASLSEIWQNPEYQEFRRKYRKRQEYHDQKLTGVSCSFAGSAELDLAVEDIKEYFFLQPAPEPCKACAKLDGY